MEDRQAENKQIIQREREGEKNKRERVGDDRKGEKIK
jgi:hypothetical protein